MMKQLLAVIAVTILVAGAYGLGAGIIKPSKIISKAQDPLQDQHGGNGTPDDGAVEVAADLEPGKTLVYNWTVNGQSMKVKVYSVARTQRYWKGVLKVAGRERYAKFMLDRRDMSLNVTKTANRSIIRRTASYRPAEDISVLFPRSYLPGSSQAMVQPGTTTIRRKGLNITVDTSKTSYQGRKAYRTYLSGRAKAVGITLAAQTPNVVLKASVNQVKVELLDARKGQPPHISSAEFSQEPARETVDTTPRKRTPKIQFNQVYSSNGTMTVALVNLGSRPFNTTEYRLRFSDDGRLVTPEEYASGELGSTGPNNCLASGPGKTVGPAETYRCSTGLEFPGPNQTVTLVVKKASGETRLTYTCEPQTAGSVTC